MVNGAYSKCNSEKTNENRITELNGMVVSSYLVLIKLMFSTIQQPNTHAHAAFIPTLSLSQSCQLLADFCGQFGRKIRPLRKKFGPVFLGLTYN